MKTIDTLELSKRLEAKGFERILAEELAETFSELEDSIIERQGTNLATKVDIRELAKETDHKIDLVRKDIELVRKDISLMATKIAKGIGLFILGGGGLLGFMLKMPEIITAIKGVF